MTDQEIKTLEKLCGFRLLPHQFEILRGMPPKGVAVLIGRWRQPFKLGYLPVAIVPEGATTDEIMDLALRRFYCE